MSRNELITGHSGCVVRKSGWATAGLLTEVFAVKGIMTCDRLRDGPNCSPFEADSWGAGEQCICPRCNPMRLFGLRRKTRVVNNSGIKARRGPVHLRNLGIGQPAGNETTVEPSKFACASGCGLNNDASLIGRLRFGRKTGPNLGTNLPDFRK
jgi:hypothetical protein